MGFTDEFAAALPAIHAGLGDRMTYIPMAGPEAEIMAVTDYSTEDAAMFSGQVQAPTLHIDVQLADVAQPAQGDGVLWGAKAYTVKTYELNADRVSWRLLLQGA